MRALLERVADRIAPEENPSGVVYGIIVIGALLAAESGRHETYLDTLLSAAIAAALYWFAHAYAETLGRRLTLHERLSVRTLARELARGWGIVRGAALPLAVIAISWAAGAAQQTAVTAALWSAIASLVAFELIAGIRTRASPRELAFEAAMGATMGVAILALKIVLH
ncbi:MAG TPA: hypothetical protein VK790_00295 [Solirubrobacteraceae bacterium]|jgi:hypothetical protein|nr:hypothetical protein [Solirubrobacteraceae bacterium]